jgi:energy-converting hydrogenase Eha subunit F
VLIAPALSIRGAGLFEDLLYNRASDTIHEASMYCIGSVVRAWLVAIQHYNVNDHYVPSHIM